MKLLVVSPYRTARTSQSPEATLKLAHRPASGGKDALTGFTLVEVMVAVAILAISLVAIFQAFSVCLDALVRTENYNQATIISLEQFWRLQDEAIKSEGPVDPTKYSGELIEDIRSFKWEFKEESIEEYPCLKEIELDISWMRGKRKGRIHWFTYLETKEEEE